MTSKILAVFKSALAVLLVAFYMVAAPLSKTYAAAGGNNGTLKIHEFGTPSGTESNDPKVCIFNLEGFGFDPNDSGYVTFEPQGGSLPVGTAAGPFSFGPTDAAGYAQSPYFNSAGGTTITDGTYKVTVYGKDAGGAINLADEKAKSKVFKVDCAPVVVLTDVTAAAVTFVDTCGTANDTYTIPATTGVTYQIAGVPVAAGTYPGSGTVTVTAVANAGYNLIGATSWQFTFTNVACPPVGVTATAPTNVDLTCVANGSYTIPSSVGVIYKVNGVITAAGTYPVSAPGSITITAEAAAGYQLTGQTSWTFVFTQPTNCGGNTVIDVCPNIVGIQTQVPVGLVIDPNGDCVVPGSGGGNTTVTPPATTPQVLAATTTPSAPPAVIKIASTPKELVNTGNSVVLNIFAGLFLIASAASLSLVTRKSRDQA